MSEATLKELATVHYGKSPNTVRVEKSAFPVFGTGGQMGFAKEPLFDGPLVVVARKGTLGNPTYSERACWVIDTAYAVIAKNDIETKWLYYNLSNYDLESLNEATGVPSISRDYLYRIEFHSSPLPQQRKIARILTTVDKLIEKTEALIAKYQAIKQGMMHDLFTRGVDGYGHLRPSYEEASELYKQSELGWIPKQWEVARIGDTLTDITYGLTVRPKYLEEGVPLISGKECRDGWIDYAACNLIAQSDFAAQRDRSIPKPGHILVTKTGTLGRVSQIHPGDPVSAITQNVALLKPNHARVVSDYLELVLTSDKIQKDIQQGVTVLSIPDLQLGILAKFIIPLPCVDEQRRISSRSVQLRKMRNAEESYLLKLQLLKSGLMQDLLTGNVRVKVDEADEVAHV